MADEVFDFPCEFPVKVMGRNSPAFREAASNTVNRHFDTSNTDVAEQLSRNGRFLSRTFTVHADSSASLDRLYEDLSGDSEILMVL